MKRTQKDYLKMLQDTIDYYSEDTTKRAVLEDSESYSGCVYKTDDGRNCAVGRFINYDNFELEVFNTCTAVSDLLTVEDDEKEYTDKELFVPEAQGFSLSFWVDLQELHDQKDYWNTSGLTEKGDAKVNKIKERISGRYYENY